MNICEQCGTTIAVTDGLCTRCRRQRDYTDTSTRAVNTFTATQVTDLVAHADGWGRRWHLMGGYLMGDWWAMGGRWVANLMGETHTCRSR
jgi:hypothetical protein